MSSERKNTGLRVALASYDVHQLRVWHQYIAEQSAEILCSEYRSGEELLQSLKQGRNTEVVVLGGPLEDMDSREFLERMSRLPQKPLLLLQDNARRERTAVSSLSPDGPCYLIRQSSLKELLASLLTAAGQEFGTLEQRFGRMRLKCEHVLAFPSQEHAVRGVLPIRILKFRIHYRLSHYKQFL